MSTEGICILHASLLMYEAVAERDGPNSRKSRVPSLLYIQPLAHLIASVLAASVISATCQRPNIHPHGSKAGGA